jgi:hypothetical protein
MPSSDFTPNNVWGTAEPVGAAHELTLPSGQTCQARKIGMEGLLEMGILDQADSLTAIAEKYTSSKKVGGPDGPTVAETNDAALLADPAALKAVIGLADRAMPVIVVSPPVALHYSERVVGKTKVTKLLTEDDRVKIREERNQPGLIFTDQIDFADKMHLFDWASGGLKGLTSFRGESTADVGVVGAKPSRPKPTKRASRNR